jgi:hypothetical protein
VNLAMTVLRHVDVVDVLMLLVLFGLLLRGGVWQPLCIIALHMHRVRSRQVWERC